MSHSHFHRDPRRSGLPDCVPDSRSNGRVSNRLASSTASAGPTISSSDSNRNTNLRNGRYGAAYNRNTHNAQPARRYSPSATTGNSSFYETYYTDSIMSGGAGAGHGYGHGYGHGVGFGVGSDGGSSSRTMIGNSSNASYSHSSHTYHYSGSGATNGNNVNHSDTDKGAAFQNCPSPYSHASSSSLPVYSASNDPFVKTDNRLKEEYSRKIHCYISEAQEDGIMPSDDFLPPVLPSFTALPSEQELPFWRPPPVLQRDPHYNHAAPSALFQPSVLARRTPETASPQIQRSSIFHQHIPAPIASPQPATAPSPPSASQAPAAVGAGRRDNRNRGTRENNPIVDRERGSDSFSSASLSSASPPSAVLPALHNPHQYHHHNYHYHQQQQQHQSQHLHPPRHTGPSRTLPSIAMPTINSLLSASAPQSQTATALPSIRSLTSSSRNNASSTVSRRMPGVAAFSQRVRPFDFGSDNNGEGLAADDGEDDDEDDDDDEVAATGRAYGGILRPRASHAPPPGGGDMKLPPINFQHGSGPSPAETMHRPVMSPPAHFVPPLAKLREPMSISSLVGAPAPENTPTSSTPAHPADIVQGDKRASALMGSVSLPRISTIAPSVSEKKNASAPLRPASQLHRSIHPAIASPTATNCPTAAATSGTVASMGMPPKGERKRSYDVADAAMSLRKMARTEPPALFAPGANSGSLVPVSSSCSLSSSPPSSSTTAASPPPSLCRTNQVVITCYHASVAQKSYGGEKRFLCPPPAVLMHGDGYSARVAHHSPMLLSVVTDAGSAGKGTLPQSQEQQQQQKPSSKGGDARPSSSAHAPLECQTSFNERNVALFKSLHVTGMQKAKSFRLRLDLLTPSGASGQMYGHDHRPWQAPEVYASLESDPVAIISKPSKKTAKARNQSSCIRAGSLISLFNRINSQTFRTKYLNVDHNTNRWVAQSHNWSPLEVVVVSASGGAAHGQQPGQKQHSANGGPLYYGSEIVLVESRRNFRSPPMIIHKVERGRLVENACSPVSQMQKVALQLKPTVSGEVPRFLKADVGHYSPMGGDASTHVRFDDPDGSPELTFEAIEGTRMTRSRPRDAPFEEANLDLDDFFCWTIVGISGFSYSYSIPAEQPKAADSQGMSLHRPQPAAICNINPMPRVVSKPTISRNTVQLSMCGFDPSTMKLLLNESPLGVSACGGGPGKLQRHHHNMQQQPPPAAAKTVGNAAGRGAASAARDEACDQFVAYLPEPVKPGLLYIRRADGVLYSTKWRVQWDAASNGAEVVPCNLGV